MTAQPEPILDVARLAHVEPLTPDPRGRGAFFTGGTSGRGKPSADSGRSISADSRRVDTTR